MTEELITVSGYRYRRIDKYPTGGSWIVDHKKKERAFAGEDDGKTHAYLSFLPNHDATPDVSPGCVYLEVSGPEGFTVWELHAGESK